MSLSVTSISESLGFEYLQHFVRFFKARTGKTPVTLFFPDAVWLATGGLNNLRDETTHCLTGRRIFLFPDLGAEEKWLKMAKRHPRPA